MPRQKLLIPFGGGLDRKSGSAVVEPDSFPDLRNVYVARGRMELRKGHDRILDIAWGTDIIGIIPMRANGLSAVIVYDSVSRNVRLYIVDSTPTATLVGTMWTIPVDAAAVGVPRISGEDIYGHVVIAHDEPIYDWRQNTKVYFVAVGLITDLELDLDRDTIAVAAKFRGVKRHLNYLTAWGYGTEDDGNRPEIFRISKAGAPIDFVPEHYFIVGSVADPILTVSRAGPVLGIFKSSEAYSLHGQDRNTFGVFPLDSNNGALTSRLAVTVGQRCYFWGINGPRVTSGGESEDLEFPLDLLGPLVHIDHLTNSEQAFAYHDPTRGEIVFVFEKWAYVLHLKERSPRWSYRHLTHEMMSAGLLYRGGVVSLTGVTPLPPAWVGRNVTGTMTGRQWVAVVRGEEAGFFTAICNDAPNRQTSVMRSNDGLTWDNTGNDSDARPYTGLAFAPNHGGAGVHLWVACASDGMFIRSAAGVIWLNAAAPPAQPWESICWSPALALFCAVSSAGAGVDPIATSPDGNTWTVRVPPAAAQNKTWKSVCWSPELALFVAVAQNGGGTNSVMTSPDGITWTMRTAPNRGWIHVTWAASLGLFVAVAGSGAKEGAVMTSPDGINWAAFDMPYGDGVPTDNIQWRASVWGPGRANLMAVAHHLIGATVALAASSGDGETWAGRDAAAIASWTSVAYSSSLNRYVAVRLSPASEPSVMTAG